MPESGESERRSRRARAGATSRVWWIVVGLAGLVAITVALSLVSQKQKQAPIATGEAPDFTLREAGGGTVTLSALKGRPVVLVFYRTYH